jgi:hypothetical protein
MRANGRFDRRIIAEYTRSVKPYKTGGFCGCQAFVRQDGTPPGRGPRNDVA